ncbi:unnamed protein product, partial [Darwinula stevensoni]
MFAVCVFLFLLLCRTEADFRDDEEDDDEVPIEDWDSTRPTPPSKVDVLAHVLKDQVWALKRHPRPLDLVFLLDASSSVGEDNFRSELAFVAKLLADFPLSPGHGRVAVVAFSSADRIFAHVDHISSTADGDNKCSLLAALRKIRYSGGGTYTLGAMLIAEKILRKGRRDANRVLILVTDGFSNGGDPIPVAIRLKRAGVAIFTFGIRNGNVQELSAMASEPKNSFILNGFREFQSLAHRALHEDLEVGEYVAYDPSACGELCSGPEPCCSDPSECTCGIRTGQVACLCPPGYYGNGIRGDCVRKSDPTVKSGVEVRER